MSEFRLPPLPLPDAVDAALLSPGEQAACRRVADQPFDWFVGAGRMLRSWQSPPELQQSVRRSLASARDLDAWRITSVGCESALAQLRSALQQIRHGQDGDGSLAPAWVAADLRDDLESVARAMGQATLEWARRLAGEPSDPTFDMAAAHERSLADRLGEIDRVAEALEPDVQAGLAGESASYIAARLAAVTEPDDTLAWWTPSVPFAPEEMAPTDSVRVPVYRLGSSLRRYTPVANATEGMGALLEAFAAARAAEPLLTLLDGKVCVHLHAPGDETELGGLIVLHREAPARLTRVDAAGEDGTLEGLRLAGEGWWLSFRDLPDGRFRLSVTATEGTDEAELQIGDGT